jgi:uncharacterized protein YbjT (DUF2867 family)
VRIGSRAAEVPFEWNDPATWRPVLAGVDAVYIAYQPDLAVPGAAATVAALAETAVDVGVRRLVLLSGRGEEEAEATEKLVRDVDPDATIVRASWFCQNFSEAHFVDGIRQGELVVPASDTPEPFVDADDIADVAVAALTEDGHAGQLYELTGPRALSFAEAVAEIARATDRPIRSTLVPLDAYAEALTAQGVPAEELELVVYLFGTVLDGRNARPADGVQRALGRAPRDFYDYAWDTARSGVWDA